MTAAPGAAPRNPEDQRQAGAFASFIRRGKVGPPEGFSSPLLRAVPQARRRVDRGHPRWNLVRGEGYRDRPIVWLESPSSR